MDSGCSLCAKTTSKNNIKITFLAYLCLACKAGYTLSNNICIVAASTSSSITFSTSLSGPTTSIQTITFNFSPTSSNCLVSYCRSCKSSTSYTCDACISGYYLKSIYLCLSNGDTSLVGSLIQMAYSSTKTGTGNADYDIAAKSMFIAIGISIPVIVTIVIIIVMCCLKKKAEAAALEQESILYSNLFKWK